VAAGAGVAGTFFALFAASAKAGRYYPWLLPLNVLTSPDRIPLALALGVGGGLLIAVLGAVDFARREEQAPPGLSRTATVVWAVLLAGLLAAAVWLQNAPAPPPTGATRPDRVTALGDPTRRGPVERGAMPVRYHPARLA
jgi:hypothetical protein